MPSIISRRIRPLRMSSTVPDLEPEESGDAVNTKAWPVAHLFSASPLSGTVSLGGPWSLDQTACRMGASQQCACAQ